MKRKIIAAFMVAAILGVTGCQKNPDSSIVKNKDIDNMIEAAQNQEEGTDDVAEMVENYNTYQTTIKNESLNVMVNVDAKVDIPTTDKMSIVRMQTREISQEFLDKVRGTLASEVKFCEGYILREETKKDIEASIRNWKKEMESIIDEDTKEEYQLELDKLEEAYESAPEEWNLADYPSDGKIYTIEEYLEQHPDSEYFEWQKMMNEKGSVYYGEGDRKNGDIVSLYVQNNENYGNCLRYQKGARESFISGIKLGSSLKNDRNGVWKASEQPTEDNTGISGPSYDISRMKKVETAELSMEEARKQADELLIKLGLTEYGYYEGDKYCELTDTGESAGEYPDYREEYVFQYLRNLDGVLVNNVGEEKSAESVSGGEYQRKEWVGERVAVCVNDNGIINFEYIAPLEISETLVDKANMKTFEEVKEIFEQMIPVTQARDLTRVEIDVDRVILRYMRISEEDSFNTGLLVPVWDFMGTVHKTVGEKMSMEPYQSVLTINAIDGSVINKEIGY